MIDSNNIRKNIERGRNRERGRQGVNHDCDIYLGTKRLGATLEIITDSQRVFHVACHGEIFLDRKSYEEGLKGSGTLSIPFEMYLVCMEFSKGKSFNCGKIIYGNP